MVKASYASHSDSLIELLAGILRSVRSDFDFTF
jgi:hypothetical protein